MLVSVVLPEIRATAIALSIFAFHLLGEVDELSPAFESMRRAGFSVYAWQRIWELPLDSANGKGPSPWQPVDAECEQAVRSLFQVVVPPLVQSAEPLPNRRLRGLIYRKGTDILAYVEGAFGPRGIYLYPLVHPDLDDVAGLLRTLPQALAGPGLFWILPIVDSIANWIDHRVMVTPFAAEKTLTRDTVPVDVDAVLFWMVWDAEKAALEAKAAAEKAAAVAKAAGDKAQADRVAALRAAQEKATAERIAAEKAAAEAKAKAPKKGVVQVRSLHIRKDHSAKSEGVGGLVAGQEVLVYETFADGKDIWARVGENQWAAAFYNGETYIKIEL